MTMLRVQFREKRVCNYLTEVVNSARVTHSHTDRYVSYAFACNWLDGLPDCYMMDLTRAKTSCPFFREG
jgi:hypothetical protein